MHFTCVICGYIGKINFHIKNRENHVMRESVDFGISCQLEH